MPLPPLTALQFAVLDVLGCNERPGREIRARLASEMKIRKSGPAFYQLMARLEDSRFVKGMWQQKIVEGQIIRERRYKILANGSAAWQRTRDFYFDAARNANASEATA